MICLCRYGEGGRGWKWTYIGCILGLFLYIRGGIEIVPTAGDNLTRCERKFGGDEAGG